MGRAIEGIIAPVWVVVLLGFSFFISGCKDSQNQYGCLSGELVAQTLVDKRVPFDVKGVDQYEETLAFSAACRDSETQFDPFTNAHRKKEGINLILCMPGWKACGVDEEKGGKVYMKLFLDANNLSLKSDLRIGRSKELLKKEKGVEIYSYDNKYDDENEYFYIVDEEKNFSVRCSDPKTTKGSCSFRGYDNSNKIGYYFIYRPPEFRDWHSLHSEITAFIDKSISLANDHKIVK